MWTLIINNSLFSNLFNLSQHFTWVWCHFCLLKNQGIWGGRAADSRIERVQLKLIFFRETGSERCTRQSDVVTKTQLFRRKMAISRWRCRAWSSVEFEDGLQLKQEGSDKKHKNWRGLEVWNDQNVQISCHEPRYDLVLIQAMQTNCNKQQWLLRPHPRPSLQGSTWICTGGQDCYLKSPTLSGPYPGRNTLLHPASAEGDKDKPA